MSDVACVKCGAEVGDSCFETCPSLHAPELNAPEPAPVPTSERPVWDLVIQDMRARDHAGRAKYGTPLQASNGRDHLTDAYQEALDLTVYLRAELERRDTLNAPGPHPPPGGVPVSEPVVAVRAVRIRLCDLCLSGSGGECHVPGCALYLNRAPDLRIDPALYKVVSDMDRAAAENVALSAFAESFAVTAEAAVEAHESRGRGGQQVGFHGDFAHVPPSAVSRLRWWAARAREALKGVAP